MTGGLSARATIVGIVFALTFLVVVFELVRRHRLQERYSLLWFAASIAILIAATFSRVVNRIASLLGIYDARIAILSLVVLLFLILLLHITTVISRLSEQITRLAQEHAILRAEWDAAQPVSDPRDSTPAPGAGTVRQTDDAALGAPTAGQTDT